MDIRRIPAPAITIRPIRPDDAADLERFYEELSDDSRRLRFVACTRGLSHPQARQFCCTDHDHREGFVAEAGPEGTTRIVGHVCLEPARDGTAEIALAVADELQGHGIGRALVDAAIAWAHEVGIDRLSATMLSENVAIRRLLTSLALPSRIKPIGFGVDSVLLDLAADARHAA
jgi:acetyltransferase